MSIGLFYCIAFIGGLITGLLAMFIFTNRINVAGTLKIDHSIPESLRFRLVVENDDVMLKKNRIVFKVDHNADLSQK